MGRKRQIQATKFSMYIGKRHKSPRNSHHQQRSWWEILPRDLELISGLRAAPPLISISHLRCRWLIFPSGAWNWLHFPGAFPPFPSLVFIIFTLFLCELRPLSEKRLLLLLRVLIIPIRYTRKHAETDQWPSALPGTWRKLLQGKCAWTFFILQPILCCVFSSVSFFYYY